MNEYKEDEDWYCDNIGQVDIAHFRKQILSIAFKDWPVNPETAPDGIVMLNHFGWGDMMASIQVFLSTVKCVSIAGRAWHNPMLSVVMPEASIRSHRDAQGGKWEMRVHFPITTNDRAFFIMDRTYNLKPGYAYRINTNQLHAIANHGFTPRIHFMADVLMT